MCFVAPFGPTACAATATQGTLCSHWHTRARAHATLPPYRHRLPPIPPVVTPCCLFLRMAPAADYCPRCTLLPIPLTSTHYYPCRSLSLFTCMHVGGLEGRVAACDSFPHWHAAHCPTVRTACDFLGFGMTGLAMSRIAMNARSLILRAKRLRPQLPQGHEEASKEDADVVPGNVPRKSGRQYCDPLSNCTRPPTPPRAHTATHSPLAAAAAHWCLSMASPAPTIVRCVVPQAQHSMGPC